MRDNLSRAFTVLVEKTSSDKLAMWVGHTMSLVFVFSDDGRLERFALADESLRLRYTSGTIFFGRKSAFDPRTVEFATDGGTRHVLRFEEGVDLGLKRSVDPF